MNLLHKYKQHGISIETCVKPIQVIFKVRPCLPFHTTAAGIEKRIFKFKHKFRKERNL